MHELHWRRFFLHRLPYLHFAVRVRKVARILVLQVAVLELILLTHGGPRPMQWHVLDGTSAAALDAC